MNGQRVSTQKKRTIETKMLQPYLKTILLNTLRRRLCRQTSTTTPSLITFTQGGQSQIGSHSMSPSKTWSNISKSSKNVIYTTARNSDGLYSCDCPGFRFRKNCRHVDIAKQSSIQDVMQQQNETKANQNISKKNDLDSELVIGIDEAGAGPVLGPMVFGAVVVSKGTERIFKQQGVRDSKDVPPKQRDVLRALIMKTAVEYETVIIEANEIDERRSKGESMNAIKVKAVSTLLSNLNSKPAVAYIDAFDNIATKHDVTFEKSLKEAGCNETIIISEHRADSKYTVVGAASLIAKTERDERMQTFEQQVGITLGSGYPSDPKTLNYLKNCKGIFPTFVRNSWKTVDRFRVKGVE